MYVYFNMPCLEQWNPRKAIVTFLNAKDRREHKDLIKRKTAQKQSYYKGVFTLADESSSDEEDDSSSVDKNINF